MQGRDLVLSLGQGRDGLEPVVRVRAGPGLEPEVWAGKGPGPQPGSGQRLGGGLSQDRDRYWVRSSRILWQGRKLNLGKSRDGVGA